MVLRLIKLMASFILVGFMSLPITAWASAPSYEQLPSHDGGFGLDPLFNFVADDFQLTQAALLQSITWWGGYGNNGYFDTDIFVIRLYSDDMNPNSLKYVYETEDVHRIPTGNFVTQSAYELIEEFQYSINLPAAFSLHADHTYWLEFRNIQDSDNNWMWEFSTNFPNPGVQWLYAGADWDFIDGRNMAFSLGLVSPVPEPEAYAMLLVGLGLLGFVARRKNQNVSFECEKL